jgi:quercetin dioxygenase-like cupin family protein
MAHSLGKSGNTTGLFLHVSDLLLHEIGPGLFLRSISGQRAMVNFVNYEPHSESPVHAHDPEQIEIVLEGSLQINVNGTVQTLFPGDLCVIPSGVPHGARTLAQSCQVIDIFSPPRTEFITHNTTALDLVADTFGLGLDFWKRFYDRSIKKQRSE